MMRLITDARDEANAAMGSFALRFQLSLEPIEAAVPARAVRLALIGSGESFVGQNHFRKSSAGQKVHRHQRVTSLVDLLSRRGELLPGPETFAEGEHPKFWHELARCSVRPRMVDCKPLTSRVPAE
jgi:hypothetical protein